MTLRQKLGLKRGMKAVCGNYLTGMQELRRTGLISWSTEDIMDARNAVGLEQHPLWDICFGTDFGVFMTDCRLYLLPHSKSLQAAGVTDSSMPHFTGYLPSPNWNSGVVLSYKTACLALNSPLSDTEASESPVWLAFAGGDQKRLDRYVENVFRRVGGYSKEARKLYRLMDINISRNTNPSEFCVLLGDVPSKYSTGSASCTNVYCVNCTLVGRKPTKSDRLSLENLLNLQPTEEGPLH